MLMTNVKSVTNIKYRQDNKSHYYYIANDFLTIKSIKRIMPLSPSCF